MKRHTIAGVSLVVAVLLVGGCAGDGGETGTVPQTGYTSPFPHTPEGDPAFDNKSAGLYRGGLVGSVGTFQISIDGAGAAYAFVHLYADGDDYDATLTTTYFDDLADPFEPDDDIVNALFTGALDGSGVYDGEVCEVLFSVDGNGDNPSVSASVDTYAGTLATYVVKETSTRLVMQYEGAAYYQGDDPLEDAAAFLFVTVSCEEGQTPVVDGWFENTDQELFTMAGVLQGAEYTNQDGLEPDAGGGLQPMVTATAEPLGGGDPEIQIEGVFDGGLFPDLIRGEWSLQEGLDTDEGLWFLERVVANGAGPFAPEPGSLKVELEINPPSLNQPGGILAGLSQDVCLWAAFAAGTVDPLGSEPVVSGSLTLASAALGLWESETTETLPAGLYDAYVLFDTDGQEGPTENDVTGEALDVIVFSGEQTTVSGSMELLCGTVSVDPDIEGGEDGFELTIVLLSDLLDFHEEELHAVNGSVTFGVDVDELDAGLYFLYGFVEGALDVVDNELQGGEHYGFYGYADQEAATAGGPNVYIGGVLEQSYDFTIDQEYSE